MKSVALKSFPRTLTGRLGVKKLRGADRVPAVIYGRHNPPQSLEIASREIDDMIKHAASEKVLVDLAVEGDPKPKRLALVQEVQHHPLSGKVLHVDLHEVAEDEKVTISIPVETYGEAVGVKTGGGVLEHVLFSIRVRGLPKDLPEVIRVDVSQLNIGDSYHISDLPLPEGVECLGDPKIPVLSVASGIASAVEASEEPAGASEPEMIKEKKEDSKKK